MDIIVERVLLIVVGLIASSAIAFAFWLRDRYVVPILTYHHIGDCSDHALTLNTVSTKSFDYQMGFLKKHGYRVISFDDLIEGLKKGYNFSRNTVVLHFDDGYANNYTNAFPILKKHGLPAMVFLISDWIGNPNFLTWDQVKEMEKHDFLAGAHTRTHAYLPNLNQAEANHEIAGSKKVIEQNLGHHIDYFVYPSGGYTEEIKEITKQAGYKAACTTNRGPCRYNQDLHAIKRVRINNGDDRFMGLILWIKLSGYYNLFRRKRDGSC